MGILVLQAFHVLSGRSAATPAGATGAMPATTTTHSDDEISGRLGAENRRALPILLHGCARPGSHAMERGLDQVVVLDDAGNLVGNHRANLNCPRQTPQG